MLVVIVNTERERDTVDIIPGRVASASDDLTEADLILTMGGRILKDRSGDTTVKVVQR